MDPVLARYLKRRAELQQAPPQPDPEPPSPEPQKMLPGELHLTIPVTIHIPPGHADPPHVTVEPPRVTVVPPAVNVEVPKVDAQNQEITFERDDAGRIVGAHVKKAKRG